MKIEAASLTGIKLRPEASGTASAERQPAPPVLTLAEPSRDEKRVAPEEVLSKIKDLTENGTYSVRFEMNRDVNELVIKVVDKDSGEVIRQIPSEELLNLSKRLQDYRGLIVNTES